MTQIRPFRAIRPCKEKAARIAALPYDVYSAKEAREVVENHPDSFLKIDRAETLFPKEQDMYAPEVYEKAREVFEQMQQDGSFVQEDVPCYYIYALTMDGRRQVGLVGCAMIDEYLNGQIKKHENTREDKELDRIRHVDTLSAQTGPIFLAYRGREEMNALLEEVMQQEALYDFTSEDGITHQVWRIDKPDVMEKIAQEFANVESVYIADGHHRCASAVKAGLARRKKYPQYDGSEEFQSFLSVLFPAQELKIYDYNRMVADRNGYTLDEFLNLIRSGFDVEEMGEKAVRPSKKGEFGMYTSGCWYRLQAKEFLASNDPVQGLDVSILQNVILSPLLKIKDPKTDERIQFVGGIRGLKALEQMVDTTTDGVAFSMYPTSMEELFAVADAGRLMPPKSTWFEPKLRSGLLIHAFEK